MEDRWMHKYLLKKHEWQYESQLLGQDPINWSKTLKQNQKQTYIYKYIYRKITTLLFILIN